jgi:ABC-type multidrug transport system fused ATPase/permease subunit
VALARIQQIWQVRPESISASKDAVVPEAIRGDLRFERVSYAYEANEPVLKNISFAIAAGRVTAVIGPNGVGKTTICHLMTNLLQPDAGRVTLDGTDIKTIDAGFLKKRIALVSQDTFLFHTSVLENLRFGRPDATKEQIMAAAEAIGIHAFIQELPEGYHTLLGDRGMRLSGGQKQLISIARALLMDPAILILDEPTAFLDPAYEEKMKQVFAHLMKGRTIVLVSHRLATIRKAEQIIALDRNGLVYSGPQSRFFQQNDQAEWMQDGIMVQGRAIRSGSAAPEASTATRQREDR